MATDRKAVERSSMAHTHRETKKRLYGTHKKTVKALMRASFGSLSVYDCINNQVLYSQWRLLKSLGYKPTEYQEVSKDFFKKIRHPDDEWIVQQNADKIRRWDKGTVLNCVFRIRNKAGIYKWIVIRQSIMSRNSNGEVTHLIGSVVNITRYKHLKKQVNKNVSMLDNLSQRNSHELRAPVATVLGLISLLKLETEKRPDIIAEIISALEVTVEKMDQVIKEFGDALDTDCKQIKTSAREQ
jgi:hypothetical protein